MDRDSWSSRIKEAQRQEWIFARPRAGRGGAAWRVLQALCQGSEDTGCRVGRYVVAENGRRSGQQVRVGPKEENRYCTEPAEERVHDDTLGCERYRRAIRRCD